MHNGDKLVRQLTRAAKAAEVTVIEKHGGHFQIRGKLLVNYYPFSMQTSAYVAATKKKVINVTPKQAVQMSLEQPAVQLPTKRRKMRFQTKARMFKKNKRCHWCKCLMVLIRRVPIVGTGRPPDDMATIEHVIPLSRGGLDNDNNRVLACYLCNQTRGNEMTELQ